MGRRKMCFFHLGRRRRADSAARGVGREARGRWGGGWRRIGTCPAMLGWWKLLGRSMEQVPWSDDDDDDSEEHGERECEDWSLHCVCVVLPIMK